jgi:predicted DNA-binding transcriptional regulator AlpA
VVVDWEKWRGLPYWTLSEAAALSLGKDPDHLAAADLDGDRRLPTLRAFQERHERLRRALELGLVGEGDAVIPARLAAWLKDAALGQVLAGTSPPNDKEISIPPRAEGPTEPPPKTERPSKGTSNTTTRGDMPRTGLVRLNQILAPAGPLPVSKSTFWAKVKDGTFPQSVRLGRATAWRAEEIWALVDEQGQKPSKKR